MSAREEPRRPGRIGALGIILVILAVIGVFLVVGALFGDGGVDLLRAVFLLLKLFS